MINNATRDTFQFIRRNGKHNKEEHTRIERKEIWNKSKGKWASCFNNYLVVFAFLSSTVEESRW